jgi:hypothetical protein
VVLRNGGVPVFFVSRKPTSCLAFPSLAQRRVDDAGASDVQPQGQPLARGVPAKDFCKRSVVWRSVAYASGGNPKDVLRGTFKNQRRAAWTDKFKRMSERLARTAPVKPAAFCIAPFRAGISQQFALREVSMASAKSSWRPLRSVVSKVLRDVRIAPLDGPRPQAVQIKGPLP